MKTLNFTQFCKEFDFPCDYDISFEAQLLGGRGLDGRISKKSINEQDACFYEKISLNKKAHELFYNMVKNGEIIDSSGKLTKENICIAEKNDEIKKLKSLIEQKQNYINLINGMKTSFLKNGNLKKGYKIAVEEHYKMINEYTNKIDLLTLINF